MGKKLREKIAEREERAAKFDLQLAQHNQKVKDTPKLRSRDRSWSDIEELISLPEGHELYVLRPKEEWRPKSYNLYRQIEDYITYLFVKYPTPRFLYKLFINERKLNSNARVGYMKADVNLSKELLRIMGKSTTIRGYSVGEGYVDDLFFDWFIVVAQGGSFAKHVKGILTKKEAHLFLHAPSDNGIVENVWWAKCIHKGMRPDLAEALHEKIFKNVFVDGITKDAEDIIDFFVKIQDTADGYLCSDLMDFLRARFNYRTGNFNTYVAQVHGENKAIRFSLKGRTLASVIDLCNDWHAALHMDRMNSDLSNKPFAESQIDRWRYEDKSGISWEISQIKNLKELKQEGVKMRHCVVSYAGECVRGTSYIFSVKEQDSRAITLEVKKPWGGDRLSIVQARGKFNRPMRSHERAVVNRWAREKGIGGVY